MIRFLDGPAEGQVLWLRRIPMPLFLRVVQSEAGTWDALDQLDDKPEPDEAIYVYILSGPQGSMHLCVRGKDRRAGGWHPTAEYRMHEEQPPDATKRDTAAWQAWAQAAGEVWMQKRIAEIEAAARQPTPEQGTKE